MSKRTPGPWKVRDFPQAVDIAAADGRYLASVKFGVGFRPESKGEALANARLISKSPELLERTKSLLKGLVKGDWLVEEIGELRALIGEIEGES